MDAPGSDACSHKAEDDSGDRVYEHEPRLTRKLLEDCLSSPEGIATVDNPLRWQQHELRTLARSAMNMEQVILRCAASTR